MADQWRYVTPCCETTAWAFRPTLGRYYCRRCTEPFVKLHDKKHDRETLFTEGRA